MKKFSKEFKNEELKERWKDVTRFAETDAIIESIIEDFDPTDFESVSELNSCLDYLYNEAIKEESKIC